MKQRGLQRERNEGERGRGETQERKHSQSSNKQGRGQRSQNAERADGPAHVQTGRQRPGARTVSQLGGEDVLGGDEQLLPEVRGFRRAV